jgi:ABC-type transport system involved in Fe-S cluster assembly fused permease/ATPase subunit
MIDMENLWQLLGKQTAIVDKPGAKDLVIKQGEQQLGPPGVCS